MCCRRPRFWWLGLLLGLVFLGTAYWYQQLPEWRKSHIRNMVRQLPEVPGRYMV